MAQWLNAPDVETLGQAAHMSIKTTCFLVICGSLCKEFCIIAIQVLKNTNGI